MPSKNFNKLDQAQDELPYSKLLDKSSLKLADEAYDRYAHPKFQDKSYGAPERSDLPFKQMSKPGNSYYGSRGNNYAPEIKPAERMPDKHYYGSRGNNYALEVKPAERKSDDDYEHGWGSSGGNDSGTNQYSSPDSNPGSESLETTERIYAGRDSTELSNRNNSSTADEPPKSHDRGEVGSSSGNDSPTSTTDASLSSTGPAPSSLIRFDSPDLEISNSCHKSLQEAEEISLEDAPENGFKLDTMITNDPERMPLSTSIINDIIGGGNAEAYKQAIKDLSSDERLQLARDLQASANEYNQILGLTPTVDREALIVDARVGREDEHVNDLDIMRGFASADEPERAMERIDLYDPGFWSGLKAEGAEVDKKQALDAVTAPYEMLAKASLEAAIAENKVRPNDTVRLREENKRNLEGHDDRAADRMISDLNLEGAQGDSLERAEELRNNLKINFANPDAVLLTENTRPLFEASAEAARKELRPSRDLQCDVWRYKAGMNPW